jgi:4-amino-4-deoxy-L-arabinose transferase-like glycosyltransferase
MIHTILDLLKQKCLNCPIMLILSLSFVLNIIGICWGLPHYLDWAIDSLAPFTMLEAAYHHFSNGWYSRYPPVHIAILTLFCAPLMGYLLLSGGLKNATKAFPFGLVDPLASLSQVILISRIVSVLMGVTIVLCVYLIVRELFDRRAALFSALIVALSYPMVYYAHTANADVPYLFWALLSIYSYLQILKYGPLKHYILFALFATLSICTKDQAYGLFLFSPLPILWIRFTEPRSASQRQLPLVEVLFDRRLKLAALVAMATFALAHNLLFNFSGFLKHVEMITGPVSEPYAEYAPTLLGQLRLLWATVLQLASSLTPPFAVLCLVGSVYCALRFPRYSLPLLVLAASYYLTLISVVRYVPLRFVLPLSMIIAFFGGRLLADVWDKAPWKTLTRAAICLAFAYAAVFPIQLDLLLIGESRYAAEQWMQEHFKKGALVETFTPDPLLKYHPRFPSWVKVRSSKLEAGTRWEPLESKKDSVRLPNMYTGREAPDYIVLSELWYARFLQDDMADTHGRRVLNELFQGYTEYTLVATFQTPTVVKIDLSINPRIDIFARREQAAGHFTPQRLFDRQGSPAPAR